MHTKLKQDKEIRSAVSNLLITYKRIINEEYQRGYETEDLVKIVLDLLNEFNGD